MKYTLMTLAISSLALTACSKAPKGSALAIPSSLTQTYEATTTQSSNK